MAISVGNTSIITKGLILYLDPSATQNYTLSNVEVLVVAGGGGGGANHAGGGGAGGLLYMNNYAVTTGVGITVTVGLGGAKSTSHTAGPIGGTGQNSVFGGLTANGGGGGGNRRDAGTVGLENGGAGGSGGGGGGQGADNNPTSPGGSGTVGQGNPGGTASYHAGAGGGGAGGRGSTTYGSLGAAQGTNFPGDGGPGLCFSISGFPQYYAGGGGGGGFIGGFYAGKGGMGGGGDGQINGTQKVNGTPNTGGGGGGANGGGNSNGGDGGSGIVIVRYPGPQKASGGNTITQVGGHTIHTFTSSGTFTPLTINQLQSPFYGLQDLSGHNNSAYQSGGVTYSALNGGVLLFDYSNDQLLTNSMQNYSYVNGITVSVWLYNGGGTGLYRGVVTNGTVADRIGGFDLRYGRENYFGGANNGTKLNWNVKNLSSTTVQVSANANVNEWHNYVGTYDNNTVRIYKDGVLFNSANGPGGQLKTMADSTTIGRSPGTNEFLDGRLGNVMIYDRALSEVEILQNFNTQKGRFGL